MARDGIHHATIDIPRAKRSPEVMPAGGTGYLVLK